MAHLRFRQPKSKSKEQQELQPSQVSCVMVSKPSKIRLAISLIASASLVVSPLLPSIAVANNAKANQALSAEETAKLQAELLAHNQAFLAKQAQQKDAQATDKTTNADLTAAKDPKALLGDALGNPLDAIGANKQSEAATGEQASDERSAALAGLPTKTTAYDDGRVRYLAGLSLGNVGGDAETGVDDVSDNQFYIQIDELPAGVQKAWLTYQVMGVIDEAGVARSINDQPAQGGQLIKRSTQWHIVKQAINPETLKSGQNVVRFNASSGDTPYQVRQVAITLDKPTDGNPNIPLLYVNPPSTSYDGKALVTGFITDLDNRFDHITVAGKQVPLHGGEFATIVDTASLLKDGEKTPKAGIKVPVSITLPTKKGTQILTTAVTVKGGIRADELVDIETPGETKYASAKPVAETLTLNGAAIELTAGAKADVAEGERISVTALRAVDTPQLDAGMVNLTQGSKAYRFLPHGTKFSNAQTVRMQYNPKAIPEGFTAHDIQTYYFDESQNRWVALDKVEVDEKTHTIVSTTTHFTDMINAVAKAPDMPETNALNPTTFSGMQAADPTSQINLMAAPTPNAQGSANISYPLQLPAGRRGLTPSLAISYNSEAGNGEMGMGWNLNLPSISIDTRWGAPRYDASLETETYSFAGEQLAPVAHRSTPVARQANKQFYPRVEGSFNKITRHGSSPANYWWEVTDKTGTRHLFGGRSNGSSGQQALDAVLTTHDGNIGHWALAQTIDPYGNTITYRYDKVGSDGNVKGQALYLTGINYTGSKGSEGAYDVVIERDSGRPDSIVNARLGYKQVIDQRIKRISMTFNGEPIRSYDFSYTQGAFYKSLLSAIVQNDDKGAEFVRHDLNYFDDFNNKPYANTESWGMPSDGLNAGLILAQDKATALSGTKSKGRGKHAALTIGLDDSQVTCKSRTVGGSVSSGKSQSEGLVAMTDINGDGLADKIIQRGDGIAYRPNMSGATMGQTQFGNLYTIAKVTQFLREDSKSRTKGFEVNPFTNCNDFSISAGISRTKSTSRTDTYFSDVNGDGLTDIVSQGQVYFNRLLDNGNIEMVLDSSQTPNPIGQSGNAKVVIDNLTAEELAAFNQQNPLQDTVKVWVAPYAGSVQIQAPVQLQAPSDGELPSADGVRVTIEAQNGTQNRIIWQNQLSVAGQTITPALSNLTVMPGDRIYFRVHAINDANSDDVLWQPVITYTDKPQTVDANGRLQYQFSAKDDFILSGRQVPKVTMPLNGQVAITGDLVKGVTSDNVRIRVTATDRMGNTRQLYTQTIGSGAGSTGINANANVQLGDTLSFELIAETRIDWTQVNWQPVVQYTSTDNANVNKALADGRNIDAFTFRAVPSMSLYQHVIASSNPIPSPGTSIQITPNLNLGNASGLVTLSVKASNGQPGDVATVLSKRVVRVVNGNLVEPLTLNTTTPSSRLLYVEITADNLGLGDALRGSRYTITTNGLIEQTYPLSVYAGSDEWLLGSLYQGFGQFVYNGNAPWGNTAIDPRVLTAQNNIANDINNIDTSTEAGLDAAANSGYNPANARFITMLPDGERQLFVGLDEDSTVSKFGISATRYGQKAPAGFSPFGTAGSAAVVKISESTTITKKLSGGSSAGGAGLSLIDGDTRIITEFMDMNGDRYPDVLSEKAIQYTNMLGTLSEQMSQLNGIRIAKNDAQAFNISGGFGQTSEKTIIGAEGETRITVTESHGRSGGANANASFGDVSTLLGIVDMNGDGLGDQVYRDGGVALNLGYTFAPIENWGHSSVREQDNKTESFGGSINIGAYSLAGGISLETTINKDRQSLFDINGDGLPDLVTNTSPLTVRLNTGSGFAGEGAWQGTDTSGDNAVHSESANVAFTACLIVPKVMKTCLNTGANWDQGLATEAIGIQDINGDGYPDLTTSNKDGNLTVSASTIGRTNLLESINRPMGSTVSLDYTRAGNTYAMPQNRWVLSKIETTDRVAKNGANRQLITAEYKDGKYDRREREFYGFGIVVTKQHDTLNGDKVDRGTIATYHTDSYHLKGLPKSQIFGATDDKLYTRTDNTYELKQAWSDPSPKNSGVGGFIADTHAAFPALTKTETKYFEGSTRPQKSKTETFAYDGYGNIVTYQDLGDLMGENGAHGLQADISYHDPNQFNEFSSGIPSRIVVTDLGTNRVLRERRTNVNAQGDITLIEAQTGAGNPAITTIKYNEMGNITALVGASNERGERLGYGYAYDKPTQSRVTAITDSYGYGSVTRYNHKWGSPVQTTDLNGNPTTYTYDSVGRLTTVTGPNEAAQGAGYTINMSYSPFADVPWAKTQHYDAAGKANGSDGSLDTVTFTDSFGRVIQTKKDGSLYTAKDTADTDGMIVSGYIKFDAFGNVTHNYYPTFEGSGQATTFTKDEGEYPPTINVYDTLNRVTQSTLPDGSVMQTDYGFGTGGNGLTQFTSTHTDPNGNTTQTFSDIDGRTTAVNNALGNGTAYGYDALGQIRLVIDAKGNKTISEYDQLGRRTSIQNPDTGTTVYGYDPAGNLIYEQTAELAGQGAFIRYVYEYNRLIRRTDPTDGEYNSRDVTYHYGKPGSQHNRAGRLVLVQDSTGSTEYYYDKLGNIALEIVSIVGTDSQTRTYIQETETDTWGRVQHIIYPDGEKVRYRYNSGGKLAAMSGRKKGHDYAYIKQLGYDEFEQRVFQWHGNNATTYYDYDVRRRLSRLKVNAYDEYFGVKQTRNLMDNRYDYDNVGNILSIENTAPLPTRSTQLGGNVTQTFDYDAIYQLTGASGEFEAKNRLDRYSVTMQYDAIHNIVSKSQTHETTGKLITNWREVGGTTYQGDYAYTDKQPHAVSNITDPDGNKQQFIYDANGRHSVSLSENKQGTQTPTRKLNWDAHGNLIEIDQNGSTQKYYYDGSGNRRIKNDKSYPFSTTVITPAGYTKHYFADGQRIASKLGNALETPLFATQPQQQAPAGTSALGDMAQITSTDGLYAHYNTLVQERSGGILEYKPRSLIVDLPDYSDENDPRGIDYEPNQYFYHQDHIGSSSYLTDDNGEVHEFYAYFPSGELFVSQAGSFGSSYKFTGKELDTETGLYYFGARYYDPRTQVWQSPDPILGSYLDGSPNGGVYNSLNLGIYTYGVNNPVRFNDPNGMWVWDNTGNLVAQNGDNLRTLASFLNTSHYNAEVILNKNGYYMNSNQNFDLKAGDILPKGNLSIQFKSAKGVVVNNTNQATAHYFNGNGQSADVGDITTNQLLSSEKFRAKHNKIITVGTSAADGFFSVDMTKDTFHIGRTNVDYAITGNEQSSTVTYTLFSRDGYWDPDFIDENTLGRIFGGKYTPDGTGPNLELPGGQPYHYKTRQLIYFYKPVDAGDN